MSRGGSEARARPRSTFALLLAACLGGFLSGCAGGPAVACTSDAECGPHAVCEAERCACTSDAACREGRVCNAFGACQAPAPCRSNQDCADGQRCDGATGACLSEARCPRDLHCSIGQVCEAERCVAGCRADPDCPLGQLCRDARPIGRCETGCRSSAGCPLGALCIGGRCFDDPYPGLCAPCGGPADCPARGDWCLENRAYDRARPETGAPRHCAADCAEAPESCPNGYGCRPVVARVALPCRADVDCGFRRRCRVEEGEPVGVCTCFSDADCTERLAPTCRLGFCEAPAGRSCAGAEDCEAVEACGPHGAGGARVCFLDRSRACTTGADCQCIEGECVLSGRSCRVDADCASSCLEGGCVVGAGCTPDEGLYCPTLR